MSAGLSIQSTTDLHSLPIAPWAGLWVSAAWALLGLVVAAVMLRPR